MARYRQLAPTAERLRDLVAYDHETGQFIARVSRGNIVAGSVLGCLHHTGYRHMKIDRRIYQASNLAWLYMTGEWPTEFIDHKDRNKANDCWSNLRLATNSQNMANRSACTGITEKGVRYRQRGNWRGRWIAQIKHDKKVRHLGHFDTREQAAAAYRDAALRLHGEFAYFGAANA